LFKISLAQWSLHRTIFGSGLDKSNWCLWKRALTTNPRSVLQGELNPLDFASTARQVYGIDAVEYVNVFFYDRARDSAYLQEMRSRSHGEGVQNLLIMCDHEGALGNPDKIQRQAAVRNHEKWAEAAQILGCHSIRVNASSAGSYEEQQKLAADGLVQLAEYADSLGIDVLIENHGGLSSNAQWLMGMLSRAGHPRLGTLPDFGNFQISDNERYDPYQGVAEMMPLARGVSAKTLDFDPQGYESTLDYEHLLKLVLGAGYHGHIGIEYDGENLSEADGIRKTKKLLQKFQSTY